MNLPYQQLSEEEIVDLATLANPHEPALPAAVWRGDPEPGRLGQSRFCLMVGEIFSRSGERHLKPLNAVDYRQLQPPFEDN